MREPRHLMRLAPAVVLAGALAASVIVGLPAAADPICTKFDQVSGVCLITVPVPAPPPAPGKPGGGGGAGAGGNQPVGAAACVTTDPPPGPVPCSRFSSLFGAPSVWSNDRNCYVGGMSPAPPLYDPVWMGRTDGSIYFCEPVAPTNRANPFATFWAQNPPVAGLPPDPAQLARQAIAAMKLHAITIGIVPEPKPGSIGLVGLPVWMWTAPTPETYGPITRSASGGGITVTATAKVKTLVWSMGDGTTVTCASPGTRYDDSFGKTDSPTCGHRYERTSLGQPGDAYQVTARSYWQVNWAGGGAQGVINIDFTAATQIRIGELQVLVTN